MERCGRRSFLKSAAVGATVCAAHPLFSFAEISQSPFRISVINDEISADFDHACYVVSHDFGLSWIELRSMWGKKHRGPERQPRSTNRRRSSPNTICRLPTSPAPLFKTDWPGAPKSPYGPKGDMHDASEVTFKQQDDILERSIAAGQAIQHR